MATLAELEARAEAVRKRYQAAYAGRNRATVDPGPIDGMVAELQEIRVGADALGEEGAELARRVGGWIELYRNERDAIRQVQADGPDAVAVGRIADEAALLRHLYRRHFAGQDRTTRDTGLLEWLASEMRHLRADLETIAARHPAGWNAELLAAMARDIEVYDTERREIPAALASLPQDRRGTALARRANAQFRVWRLHFANKSRATRSVELLERSIATTRAILADMNALRRDGFEAEPHLSNIQKVTGHLALLEEELPLVRRARAQTDPAERGTALADEANALFQVYRDTYQGRARSEVDPEPLHDLCDQLHVVRRTMQALDREAAVPVNRSNIDVVTRNLKLYEREHERVVAARA